MFNHVRKTVASTNGTLGMHNEYYPIIFLRYLLITHCP